MARIYGYANPDELLHGITDIRAKPVCARAREEFRRIMDEHDTLTGLSRRSFSARTGSIIWISENCRVIQDAKGRLLHYEGTVEDITARRQAQGKRAGIRGLIAFTGGNDAAKCVRKDLLRAFTLPTSNIAGITAARSRRFWARPV